MPRQKSSSSTSSYSPAAVAVVSLGPSSFPEDASGSQGIYQIVGGYRNASSGRVIGWLLPFGGWPESSLFPASTFSLPTAPTTRL
jgi:hypothetical protein